jgi:hypothetical protein
MKWFSAASAEHVLDCVSSTSFLSGCEIVSATFRILFILILFVVCLYLFRGVLSEKNIKIRTNKSQAAKTLKDLPHPNSWSPTSFIDESFENDLAMETRRRVKSLRNSKNKVQNILD